MRADARRTSHMPPDVLRNANAKRAGQSIRRIDLAYRCQFST